MSTSNSNDSTNDRTDSPALVITEILFSAADAGQRSSGLLGWIELTVNSRLKLYDLALRRTLDGRFTISYPKRIDSNGTKRAIVRPLDDPSRREIEAIVFKALALHITEDES